MLPWSHTAAFVRMVVTLSSEAGLECGCNGLFLWHYFYFVVVSRRRLLCCLANARPTKQSKALYAYLFNTHDAYVEKNIETISKPNIGVIH